MAPYTLRPATPHDAGAIAEIYGHYVLNATSTFELEKPDASEMMRRMQSVLELGLPFLVAEEAGEVIGTACGGPFRSRGGYRFTVEHSIYIAPSHLRRGIGGHLLAELIAQCTAAGAKQMVAVIGGDNPASVALHARHGFHHAGMLHNVGYKFDRWLDLVFMQRALL